MKLEDVSAPLPAALPLITEAESERVNGEAKGQMFVGLDSMKAGGKAALTSLRAYLSKLQTGKAEYEREIRKVESVIRIFESSD